MILFFLPHAGGSAKSYCSFKRFLPKDLTVIPMELSGRFTRSTEPFLTDIPSCAEDLLNKHGSLMESEDYAVFGHSMGTLLACCLIQKARERGIKPPVHVFLSGRCSADDEVQCVEGSDKATDEEIVEFFSSNELSTTSPIKDEELIKSLNRVLCADVRMADSYRISADCLDFGCDMTVLYGRDDVMLKNSDMSKWSRFTSGKCEVKDFSGGHFYYADCKEEICGIIRDKLKLQEQKN